LIQLEYVDSLKVKLMNENNLNLEATAFDNQIEERIKNGHIPDLRLAKPCNYFFNNPWRHPEYVKLDFYEQYELIKDSILKYCDKISSQVRLLEVGCGPGYLSLELARAGFNVVGIDLSPKVIEIAKSFADKDPYSNERGSLNYFSGDFFKSSELINESFDAVIFLGALHHFPEQKKVLERSKDLLRGGG
jgi:2-polyprenyl-6-hydroxyphenyl methylase/3-demethylubiquinone-9 3-methyltransferase